MPDLSASWDIPNPFGLMSADFDYDLDGYRAALGFLSDLAGGTDHDKALEVNGGTRPMLVGWQRNRKFARVYAKAKAAGAAEAAAALERDRKAQEATEAPEAANPPGQTFVTLEDGLDALERQRTVFSYQPGRQSWGGE